MSPDPLSYAHFDNPDDLALWKARSELAQLMGWLKDGDVFGRWETAEDGKTWIRNAEPIKATLDDAQKSLPPDWPYQGAILGSEYDQGPDAPWKAFAKMGSNGVTISASGKTELLARFNLAVAVWKRQKEAKP